MSGPVSFTSDLFIGYVPNNTVGPGSGSLDTDPFPPTWNEGFAPPDLGFLIVTDPISPTYQIVSKSGPWDEVILAENLPKTFLATFKNDEGENFDMSLTVDGLSAVGPVIPSGNIVLSAPVEVAPVGYFHIAKVSAGL